MSSTARLTPANGMQLEGHNNRTAYHATKAYILAIAVVLTLLVLALSAMPVQATETHAVTYDPNGGTGPVPETQYVEEGSEFSLAQYKGTKTGYEFSGWDDGTGIIYMPGTKLRMGTTDMNMKASWDAIRYIVYFEPNEGQGQTITINAKYDVMIPNPSSSFHRDGFMITSWNTAKDGTGTSYSATENLVNLTTTDGARVTLFAQWAPAEYKVTYQSDSSAMKYEDTVVFNSLYTIRGALFTKTGYTQVGWTKTMGSAIIDYQLSKEVTWSEAKDVTLYPVWSINQYTVRFDANGGSGSMASITDDYGSQVIIPENGFRYDNHTFGIWNTKADGSGVVYAPGVTMKLLEDTTLYAQWKNDYRITYDTAGGTPAYNDQTFTDYSSEITVKLYSDSPKLTGYTFGGWTDGTDTYQPGAQVTLTESSRVLNLRAVWTANQYDVIYDPNMSGAQKITDKATYDSPYSVKGKIFTREGYVLEGWSKTKDGKIDYILDDLIPKWTSTESMTLYACWKIVSYVISFDKNGGSGSMEPISAEYGEIITVPECYFYDEDRGFASWNTMPDGSGTTYMPDNKLKVESNLILYAQWNNVYTIKYDVGEGSGSFPDQTALSQKSEYTMTLNKNSPTRTGYTFGGWTDGTNIYQPSEKVTLTVESRTLTLHATWNANQYNVVYDPNMSGTDKITDIATYDSPYTVKGKIFTKDGYVLEGWSKTKNGKIDYILDDLIPKWTSTEGMTLYACWKVSSYSVSFDRNGGSGYMDPMSAEYGQTITVPESLFYDEDREFASWNTKADGTGTSYIPGNKLKVESNVILYAQWNNVYTIKYDVGEGSGSFPDQTALSQKSEYTMTLNKNSPTRIGYSFGGWTDGTNTYQPSAKVTLTVESRTLTLHAVWIADQYDIIYDPNMSGAEKFIDKATYDSPYTLQGEIFTREGYTLEGWSKTRDGKIEYVLEDLIPKWTSTKGMTLYACWKIVSCTVTFDKNGGTGYMDPISTEYGKTITIPDSKFVYDNKEFSHWNTKADGTGASYYAESPLQLKSDVTLYAQWNNVFLLKYDIGEGSGDFPDQRTLSKNDEVTMTINSKVPTLVGFVFKNWTTSPTSTSPAYNPGDTIKLTTGASTVTLYAQWIANEYTVTYKSGVEGQADVTDTATFNQTYTLKGAIFTKEGFQQSGWSEAPGQPAKYPLNYTFTRWTFTEDMTLYACWDTVVYTISFDPNGGTGEIRSIVAGYNTKIAAPECGFYKEGCTFIAWNTKADGSGISYKAGDAYVVLGDAKLYATWAFEYILKFDPNGGTGAPATITKSSVDKQIGITIPDMIPTLTGYEFAGWASPDIPGKTFQPKDTIVLDSEMRSVTLYAEWAACKYTITYTNGSTHTTDITDTAVYDQPFQLKDKTFDRPGYVQAGWKSDEGTIYPLSYKFERWVTTKDVTFEAYWSADTCLVTFMPNGGTGTMNPVSVKYQDTFRIPECTYLREGFEFQNWNTKANGTGTTYEVGQTIIVNEDMKLYAQWSYRYTLTYDANGGKGQPAAQVVYSTNATYTFTISKVTPTKSGQLFLGWSTSMTAQTAEYQPGSKITLTYDNRTVALYAVWSDQIVYTITYMPNGGTGAPPMQEIKSNQKTITVNLSTVKPTRSGYDLLGWSTSPEGTAVLPSGASVTLRSSAPNLVLYAIWATNIIEVESIELTFTPGWVSVGSSIKLKAQILPENSTQRMAVWSVDNPELASISMDGVLTGISPGKVKVTARAGNVSASAIINVSKELKVEVSELGGKARVTNIDEVVNHIHEYSSQGIPVNITVPAGIDDVLIDVDIVNEIKRYNTASLTIQTPAGTLRLSSAALSTLAVQNSLEFTIDNYDPAARYPNLGASAGLQLCVIIDEQEKAVNFGDKVIVSTDYTLQKGESADKIQIVYVTSGKTEPMSGAFYDEGKAWFSTTHFSDFAIVFEKEPVVTEDNPWIWIVVLLALVILALVIIMSRRSKGQYILVNATVEKDGDDGSRAMTKKSGRPKIRALKGSDETKETEERLEEKETEERLEDKDTEEGSGEQGPEGEETESEKKPEETPKEDSEDEYTASFKIQP